MKKPSFEEVKSQTKLYSQTSQVSKQQKSNDLINITYCVINKYIVSNILNYWCFIR